MKIQRQVNLIKYYYLAVIIFYCIYNTVFGWNKTPKSTLEMDLDRLVQILLFLGLGYIINIFLGFVYAISKKEDL